MFSVDDGYGWAGCSGGFRDAGKQHPASLRPWQFARGATTARADFWFRAGLFAAHHRGLPNDDGADLSIQVPRRWSWPDGHGRVERIATPGFARAPGRDRDDPGGGGLPAAT